jgi:hypothetical protein
VKCRPQATVRVLSLPHIDAEAVRIEIDCRYSTTGLTHVPSALVALTRAMLITNAIYAHEERCGDCDTAQAHEQGDPAVREATEAAWSDLVRRAAGRYAESVRN